MINPYGSKALNLLLEPEESSCQHVIDNCSDLPHILLNSAAAANLVMLGAGYFNPLTGFMNKADALSICGNFCTTDGLFWPVPVINMFNSKPTFGVGSKICLQDPNIDGNPVMATMNVSAVEEVSDDEINFMLKSIYGTTDSNHPGVVTFKSLGNFLVSGSVTVLNLSYFHTDFPGTFRTAQEIRDEIQSRGWDKVVAFQTRNPMHRAHEELCRMAMERLDADGLIVHMLLGKLKLGDLPAEVRDDCIRTMVDNYFPENSVMVTGYGFDMLYAGPREALLHAIFRQNMGATHLIVGRDHAGVGDFYGPFEAQEVFETDIVKNSLKLKIFSADHTAYSKKLNEVVMMRDVKDHNKDDFVLLSGTKVREMLSNGEELPQEFARKEVAEILMKYYQSL